MSYFKEFDAIKRAKEKYDKDIKQLEDKIQEKKNVKFQVEHMEQRRKEQLSKLQQQVEDRKAKYQKDLKKGYKREFEKIASSTGYGESNAVETETEIKHLEGKSQAEIQMKANQFNKNGNHEGLRLLENKISKGEIPNVNLGDYESFDDQVEQLDNYFKGKYGQTTSRIGETGEAVGELKDELGLI
ncbi:hypothetical protein C8C76_16310 [Halanaerobium saccharolyticum]|uniref:Uncharacterized protein n=1 Tax=Halanaerobium saccharolyticum TaxID=43595 RepID=A0A2T5RFA2_9FIRM|nr:hypothetical protein [Halanaerobium saccharolyticum]PTV92903.1 hypothetical protein C8C76_16310 [Halanaerobium saccharolyticum]